MPEQITTEQLKIKLNEAGRGSLVLFGPDHPYIEKQGDGAWENGYFGMPDIRAVKYFIPVEELVEYAVVVRDGP